MHSENTPNFEPINPLPEQVEGALLELNYHNSRHSGIGKSFGTLMKALVARAGPLEGNAGSDTTSNLQTPDEEIVDEVGEAMISEDLLGLTADPVFEGIGLARIGSSGKTIKSADEKEKVILGRQELLVVQPTRFADFLDSTKGRLESLPATKTMIKDVYAKLLNIIEMTAEEQGEDSDFVRREALEILSRLQSAYAELEGTDHLDIPLQRGLSFLNWGNKEEFTDFLKARNLGLREPGNFSASEWHLDSTGEVFVSRWDKIFEHYKSTVDRFGPDNELSVLMRAEIQGAIESSDSWLKAPTYENKVYLDDLSKGFAHVRQRAASEGLIDTVESQK